MKSLKDKNHKIVIHVNTKLRINLLFVQNKYIPIYAQIFIINKIIEFQSKATLQVKH